MRENDSPNMPFTKFEKVGYPAGVRVIKNRGSNLIESNDEVSQSAPIWARKKNLELGKRKLLRVSACGEIDFATLTRRGFCFVWIEIPRESKVRRKICQTE